MITKNHVHVDNVMKTPQFWLVWLSLASVGATGMGVLSVANNMMADIFSRFMPELVTGCVRRRVGCGGCELGQI